MSENKNTHPTGRYNIGEELYGIAFTYKNKEHSSINSPLLLDDEMPQTYHFVKLTVSEHHKVSWAYATKDDKKYDGYILNSDDNRVFHNQYPRANYGQLSDIDDRVFSENVLKGMKSNKENPSRFILISEILDNLDKALTSNQLENTRKGELQKLKDEIVDAFKKKFPGKTLGSKVIWKELPDLTTTIVIDEFN